MIPTELAGHVVFWDGDQVPIVAHITADVVDGCRVYVAELSEARMVRTLHLDVVPAHSTVQLRFVPPKR